MSRPMLILTVALAAYAMLNVAASIVVALAWRSGIALAQHPSPVIRARRLLCLRASSSLGPALLTLGVVTPAFAIFEPDRPSEVVGPLVIVLALLALIQIAVSLGIALAAALRTRAAARTWLHGSVQLSLDPPAGVPAYVIDAVAPIVALVGAFRPKLVAARSVIEACTAAELAAIVAHERGHLYSRDNLKRLLLACTPDALRWTAVHQQIAAAWNDAAEDAADDAATPGDAASRVDLAALLIKIARLTPQRLWPAATVSPFVEPHGLDRRVRRLLAGEGAATTRPHGALTSISLAAGCAAVTTIVTAPETLERLYRIIEAVVALGR
jgi:Zn-dependent protease with chaperone function